MTNGRFGLSTRLFLDSRLAEAHLDHIAQSGFTTLELVAHPSHFDCSDLSASPRLASWLASRSMALHSVLAWSEHSLAAADTAVREKAVKDVRAALDIARDVRFEHLVVSVGTVAGGAPADNHMGAAKQSLETLAEAAAGAGVRVAVEVLPNPLSSPDELVRLLEGDLEDLDIGICLDYGRAHLMGDLADAIETVSGHVSTTHLHDNRRRADDHLPPFAGNIDWEAAMMETQKIGYDGRLILEVAPHGAAADTLTRCAAARDRLQRAFEWSD